MSNCVLLMLLTVNTVSLLYTLLLNNNNNKSMQRTDRINFDETKVKALPVTCPAASLLLLHAANTVCRATVTVDKLQQQPLLHCQTGLTLRNKGR
jgi:hypothetical protein